MRDLLGWLSPYTQRGPGLCAPTLRGYGVLFLLTLRELEVSDQLGRVVCSGHRQAIAGARRLGSLPVVDELVPSGVEPQPCGVGRHYLFDGIRRSREGRAADLLSRHRRDGAQVLLLGVSGTSEELELRRYCRAALHCIHGIVHVDR